jgi:hypothetical protein
MILSQQLRKPVRIVLIDALEKLKNHSNGIHAPLSY